MRLREFYNIAFQDTAFQDIALFWALSWVYIPGLSIIIPLLFVLHIHSIHSIHSTIFQQDRYNFLLLLSNIYTASTASTAQPPTKTITSLFFSAIHTQHQFIKQKHFNSSERDKENKHLISTPYVGKHGRTYGPEGCEIRLLCSGCQVRDCIHLDGEEEYERTGWSCNSSKENKYSKGDNSISARVWGNRL